MKTSKGFTLVEISIVLILLGMVAMMGMNAFVQIVRNNKDSAQKKENQDVLRSALYYIQTQGKLPNADQFQHAISNKRDIFGNNYIYVPAEILDNETICAYKGATDFSVRFCHNQLCDDNETIDNVSFVFYSNGGNARSESILESTPQRLTIHLSGETSDDIPEYYTLLELKAAAQCGLPDNKYAVRFTTLTLPPVNKKNANLLDSALIAATGKETVFKWCVTNFTDIANFSDSNKINIKSGSQTMYFRSNCDDLDNFDYGNKYLQIITTGLDPSDKDPKIGSFDVYVMDNRSNPIKETFFYQLFYNP